MPVLVVETGRSFLRFYFDAVPRLGFLRQKPIDSITHPWPLCKTELRCCP